MQMIIGIFILFFGSVIGYLTGGAVMFRKMISDNKKLLELADSQKSVIELLERSIKALAKDPKSGPSKEIALYFMAKNAFDAAQSRQQEGPRADNVVNIRRD